MAEIQVQWMCY